MLGSLSREITLSKIVLKKVTTTAGLGLKHSWVLDADSFFFFYFFTARHQKSIRMHCLKSKPKLSTTDQHLE